MIKELNTTWKIFDLFKQFRDETYQNKFVQKMMEKYHRKDSIIKSNPELMKELFELNDKNIPEGVSIQYIKALNIQILKKYGINNIKQENIYCSLNDNSQFKNKDNLVYIKFDNDPYNLIFQFILFICDQYRKIYYQNENRKRQIQNLNKKIKDLELENKKLEDHIILQQ